MSKSEYPLILGLILVIVIISVGTIDSSHVKAETNADLESWHFRVPIIDGGTITRLDTSYGCKHVGKGHFMDITAGGGNIDEGVPVYAVGKGVITAADADWDSDSNDEGINVRQTSYGVTFRYEHLAKKYVEAGQQVDQGDLIGLLGDTGESLGAHLHWDAWVTATDTAYDGFLQIQNVEESTTSPCTAVGRIEDESLDVNHWYHPENTPLDHGCPNYFNKEAEFRAVGLYHVTIFDHSNCLGNYKQIFAPGSYLLGGDFNFDDRMRSIYIPPGNPNLGIQGWSVKLYAHNGSGSLVSSCRNTDMWNLDTDTYENSTVKIGFDREYGLTNASNISNTPTQIGLSSSDYQTSVSNALNMVSRIDVFDNPTCTPPPGGLVLGTFTDVGGIGGGSNGEPIASGDAITVHADPPYTGTGYGWHDPGKYNLTDYLLNKITSIGVTSGWSIALFDGLNQTGPYICISANDPDLIDNILSDSTNANDRAESVIVFNNSNCSGIDLPDLAAEEVFVSLTTGTTIFETLNTGQPSYTDWHFANKGGTTATGSFYADLWINNTRFVHQQFSNVGSQVRIGFDDVSNIVSDSGWLKVRLVIDPDNAVAELDESNNVWEKDFFWDAPNYLEAVGCSNVADPGVILAQDTYCGGNYDYLVLPGSKNLTTLNEAVSAIRIPPVVPGTGISVMVYKDANMSGQKTCFNDNVEDLSLLTWPDGSPMNDSITSFEVFFNEYCITQGSSVGQLVLYGGANFSSSATSFNVPGRYNLPSNVDNSISSMDIANGWSVLLYDDDNQSGNSICRNSDDPDFASDTYNNGAVLNDTVTSIKLFDTSDCSLGSVLSLNLGNTLRNRLVTIELRNLDLLLDQLIGPIFKGTAITDGNGTITDFSMKNVSPGMYNIMIKPEGWLRKQQQVNLVSGANPPINLPLDASCQCGGDIDGNNKVDILDYQRLSNDFGKTNSPADLNGDGPVNILDFTILSNGFGKLGDGGEITTTSPAALSATNDAPGQLTLISSSNTPKVGDIITVNLDYNTATLSMAALDAMIDYDQCVLQPITNQIIHSGIFATTPIISTPGTLEYEGLKWSGVNPGPSVSGSGHVASIPFRVIASLPSSTTLAIRFRQGSVYLSNMAQDDFVHPFLGSIGNAIIYPTGTPQRTSQSVQIIGPSSGEVISQNIVLLKAKTSDSCNGIHQLTFYISYDGQWHPLSAVKTGTDIWSAYWDASRVVDQVIKIKAFAGDFAGNGVESPVSGKIRLIRSPKIADTGGVFRPSNGLLYLKNSHATGFADIAINYGLGGDYPVVGDWDGDGTVTIGIYRNGSFYLRNSNTLGFADIVFPFGVLGDQPIAGDWNADGVDTIGVYRPSIGQFLLRNSNSEGVADVSFYLGNVGDVGIAGDWTRKGYDTVGVFRPSNGVIFLKNKNESGFADIALNYGLPGDKPVTGDWDGDGDDTIGIYRNGIFYLRNSNTIGFAEIVFGLGNPGDMPIAGNWDGLP